MVTAEGNGSAEPATARISRRCSSVSWTADGVAHFDDERLRGARHRGVDAAKPRDEPNARAELNGGGRGFGDSSVRPEYDGSGHSREGAEAGQEAQAGSAFIVQRYGAMGAGATIRAARRR
jgi:hypothetical protein